MKAGKPYQTVTEYVLWRMTESFPADFFNDSASHWKLQASEEQIGTTLKPLKPAVKMQPSSGTPVINLAAQW